MIEVTIVYGCSQEVIVRYSLRWRKALHKQLRRAGYQKSRAKTLRDYELWIYFGEPQARVVSIRRMPPALVTRMRRGNR